MSAQELIRRLLARKLAIEAAWMNCRAQPGSEQYQKFYEAFSQASKRYWRASIWLRV